MDANNGAGPDAGSRAARLGDLERQVPPPSIADVWLFPPLERVEASEEFLLFTTYLEDGARSLHSARMMPENGAPAHQIVVEHGRAPARRIPGLVAALQRRLGQAAPVRHVAIEGDGERWASFVRQAAEA